MPEMHLRQSRLTYSAGAPFTKNKESLQKFKEKGNLGYIYQNEPDKSCFQHDMAWLIEISKVCQKYSTNIVK